MILYHFYKTVEKSLLERMWAIVIDKFFLMLEKNVNVKEMPAEHSDQFTDAIKVCLYNKSRKRQSHKLMSIGSQRITNDCTNEQQTNSSLARRDKGKLSHCYFLILLFNAGLKFEDGSLYVNSIYHKGGIRESFLSKALNATSFHLYHTHQDSFNMLTNGGK